LRARGDTPLVVTYSRFETISLLNPDVQVFPLQEYILRGHHQSAAELISYQGFEDPHQHHYGERQKQI